MCTSQEIEASSPCYIYLSHWMNRVGNIHDNSIIGHSVTMIILKGQQDSAQTKLPKLLVLFEKTLRTT